MTKTAKYQAIDPSELSISNDPYTGRERSEEGKYAPLFRKVKRGSASSAQKAEPVVLPTLTPSGSKRTWEQSNRLCAPKTAAMTARAVCGG